MKRLHAGSLLLNVVLPILVALAYLRLGGRSLPSTPPDFQAIQRSLSTHLQEPGYASVLKLESFESRQWLCRAKLVYQVKDFDSHWTQLETLVRSVKRECSVPGRVSGSNLDPADHSHIIGAVIEFGYSAEVGYRDPNEFFHPRSSCPEMTDAKGKSLISVMLAVDDAPAALAWYKKALGARELWNLGSVIGMEIDGAPILLGQPENNGWETPTKLGAPSNRIELFCDAPDASTESAVAAGASGSLDRIRTHQMPWGPHRQGGFVDPFGHKWLVGDRSPLIELDCT